MSGAKDYYDRLLSGQEKPSPEVALAMQSITRLGVKETNDDYDWVPTRQLYAHYQATFPAPHASIAQFGLALRLLFPQSARVVRRLRESGVCVAGWSGLGGKLGQRSVDREFSNTRRRITDAM